MENGKIIGCALTPRTIAARINTLPNDTEYGNEGEEANEDFGAIRKTVDAQ